MTTIVYLIAETHAETNIIEKKDGRKEYRRNTDWRILPMIHTSIFIINNPPLHTDIFRSLFW
jgi:hypothetical protein